MQKQMIQFELRGLRVATFEFRLHIPDSRSLQYAIATASASVLFALGEVLALKEILRVNFLIGAATLDAGTLSSIYNLPDEPEHLFSEEASRTRRVAHESIQYVTGAGWSSSPVRYLTFRELGYIPLPHILQEKDVYRHRPRAARVLDNSLAAAINQHFPFTQYITRIDQLIEELRQVSSDRPAELAECTDEVRTAYSRFMSRRSTGNVTTQVLIAKLPTHEGSQVVARLLWPTENLVQPQQLLRAYWMNRLCHGMLPSAGNKPLMTYNKVMTVVDDVLSQAMMDRALEDYKQQGQDFTLKWCYPIMQGVMSDEPHKLKDSIHVLSNSVKGAFETMEAYRDFICAKDTIPGRVPLQAAVGASRPLATNAAPQDPIVAEDPLQAAVGASRPTTTNAAPQDPIVVEDPLQAAVGASRPPAINAAPQDPIVLDSVTRRS
ncbi:hypothetical protein CYMTET_7279 [Cymbomonas tetramitiformis]|uniref:Uncharacterized protein n=1 Tax=Cymbomonas tetramitiformis TaxID=36881 RepID=A0AAE0GVZ7_9CHLO|nr:hypothetical protein CYMTET_7279 [Cymbomonas tetramitiformis]